MKYLLINKKIWLKKNYINLNKKIFIRNEVNQKEIELLKPKIIFFLHWSKLIPKKLYDKYLCIQFHSSDLPKFRGGSPVQNQIQNNIIKTKLTAFKIEQGFDTGKVCMKEKLSLAGNAQDIFQRIEKISLRMINKIIKIKNLKFIKQKKIGTYYRRRTPDQSNLLCLKNPNFKRIFDFIRMLDADGYPKSYLNYKNFKILLNDAKIYKNYIDGKFKVIKKK